MVDILEIIAVCGPPGCGKSTFIDKRKSWGDLIVDTDAIYQAVSGLPAYDKPDTLLSIVFGVRDYLLYQLTNCNTGYRGWIVAGGSALKDREDFRALGARVIVIEASLNTCLRNIRNDPRREKKWQLWEPLIKKWWSRYERSNLDEIIKV